jgi:ERF superfamily
MAEKVDADTGEIEPTRCELNGDAKVAERWHWVLSKLPAIPKSSRNQQQGFNYRSIDQVLDQLKPLLSAAGVFILPARQQAQHVEWQAKTGGAIHVTRVAVDWQIWGVNGDWITAQTVGEAADAYDKATSKAQTAAFKYLLWPSLAINENDDNDGHTPEETVRRPAKESFEEGAAALRERVATMDPPTSSGAEPASMKQVNKVRIQCRDLGYAEEGSEIVELVESLGEPGWSGSLVKLEKWQASALIDKLNA